MTSSARSKLCSAALRPQFRLVAAGMQAGYAGGLLQHAAALFGLAG